MGIPSNSTNNFVFESKNQNNIKNEKILNDTGRVVSIIGPSLKGKAFIPQGFTTYSPDTPPTYDSFSENIGDIYTHYKHFQTRIQPIFSSFVALNSNAQVNYLRPLGINLASTNLKPGVKIGADNKTNKLYALCFTCNKKDEPDLNRYNYRTNINNSNKILAGFIITSKNISIANTELSKIIINENTNAYKFKLNITGNISNNFNNNIQNIPNDNDVIFINNNMPNSQIYFNFNKDDIYYWKKVLNTNIDRLEELGYAFINAYDIFDDFDDILKDPDGDYTIEELHSDYLNFDIPYSNASSPWFVSQGYYGDDENSKRIDEFNLVSRVKKLFRFHSNIEGSYGNNIIISIIPKSLGDSDIWAKFDIEIYDRFSGKSETITSVNLNNKSADYICRKIGNKQNIFDVNGSDRIVTVGEYNVQNQYIWVEVSEEVEKGIIPKNTIPSGFIEKNKLKNTIKKIDNSNINLNSPNYYVNQPIFESNSLNANTIDDIQISDKHSWGRKIYKYNSSHNSQIISSFVGKNENNQTSFTSKEDIIIKNIKKYDITNYLNTKNYLISNFFDITDLNNLNNEDIFHLEKISLINKKKENIESIKQDMANYVHSGENLLNLTSDLYGTELFEFASGSINNDNIPFYYLTMKKSILTNTTINNNFLRYSVDMSGGWDGLNIFDIEQKTMTDQGILNNPYIKELYKYVIDIAFEKENGLNNIIYIPGITNNELVNYCASVIDNNERFKSFLIFDVPIFDSNLNRISYEKYLNIQNNENQKKWSDQIYEYNSDNQNIEVLESQNLQMWKDLYNISNKNVAGYANNVYLTIGSGSLNFENSSDIILPAGVMGLKYILDSNNITNITNLEGKLNKFIFDGVEYNIKNIFTKFDEQTSNWETEINPRMTMLKINVLIQKNSQGRPFSFNTSRTLNYIDSGNNQNINNFILYRLVMNEVKRIVENYVNRNLIFQTVKTKKEMLINYKNQVEVLMASILNTGIISGYSVRLDDQTTSDEDMLNNIVKFEVELKFPGQKNVLTNSVLNPIASIMINN